MLKKDLKIQRFVQKVGFGSISINVAHSTITTNYVVSGGWETLFVAAHAYAVVVGVKTRWLIVSLTRLSCV